MTYQVSLPWPPPALSPNARKHWAEKARAAKKARYDARIACMAAGIPKLPWERLHVAVSFHAPNWRPYDSDNALSRAKSSLDGIADATGIDDRHWTYAISRGEPIEGGQIIVTLTECAA